MSDNEDEKYLDRVYEAFFESSKQFDRQIIYIASGALALSFTFIKDIVDLDLSKYKWLLITAWILLAIVILLNLVSHYLSIQALNKKLEFFHVENEVESDKLNKWVKGINLTMTSFLVLGIVLIIIFVGINI